MELAILAVLGVVVVLMLSEKASGHTTGGTTVGSGTGGAPSLPSAPAPSAAPAVPQVQVFTAPPAVFATPSDIAQYAANAGFTGDDLVTAVAIAMAESGGGNMYAYNPERQAGARNGYGSYGLWQIYVQGNLRFLVANGYVDETAWPPGINLFDPQTNAQAAFDIYSSTGGTFDAWTTYGSGRYQAFLDTAAAGANDAGVLG